MCALCFNCLIQSVMTSKWSAQDLSELPVAVGHDLELASTGSGCHCGNRRQPYPGAGRPRPQWPWHLHRCDCLLLARCYSLLCLFLHHEADFEEQGLAVLTLMQITRLLLACVSAHLWSCMVFFLVCSFSILLLISPQRCWSCHPAQQAC